jgi:hypothetical protein
MLRLIEQPTPSRAVLAAINANKGESVLQAINDKPNDAVPISIRKGDTRRIT